MHLVSFKIQINVVEARTRGQARHGGHGANQGVEKASTHAGPDLSNRDGEALGSPLQLGVGGKGKMGLGHADGQVIEALSLVAINVGLSLGRELDITSAIDLFGNGGNLVLDGEGEVVEETEVGLGLTGSIHSLCQVLGTLSTLCPVAAKYSIKGSILLGQALDGLHLCLGVGGKDVDGNHNWHAKLFGIFNLFLQIAKALLNLDGNKKKPH